MPEGTIIGFATSPNDVALDAMTGASGLGVCVCVCVNAGGDSVWVVCGDVGSDGV